MANMVEQRPLGELFSELAKETANLVRHEVELAKVELAAKAKAAGYDVAQIAVGGIIAYFGGLALLAAVVFLLAEVMPLWASALVVGLAILAAGGVTAFLGVRALQRLDPAPRQTLRTLQENKQWLREQVSR